jgi:hypothetical protein
VLRASSHPGQLPERSCRVLAATLTYLVVKGLWLEAYWSFVTHPADAAAETEIQPQRLYYAARFWIVSWSPALALGAFGTGEALRRRVGLVDAGLWAWLFTGIMLIVMQVISWWEYHFFLLFVPAGLLATRGVEAASHVRLSLEPGAFRLRHTAAAVALLLLFAPPWFHPTDRLWKRLLADLDEARPPYVRVSAAGLQGIVEHRHRCGMMWPASFPSSKVATGFSVEMTTGPGTFGATFPTNGRSPGEWPQVDL